MSDLEDPLYKDWVRSALSLKYLKEGIYGFVDQFAKQHHSNLLLSYIKGTGSPATSCTECTSENLMPDHPRHQCIQKFRSKCFCNNPVGRRKCPNNFCSRLYDLIVIAHDERNPLWINTDPRKWYSDHWEIAKCYLSTIGYSEQGTAADTDAAGLLSIIINNIEIRNYVCCIDNIRKVRDIRNDIMHSKSFQVDQSSLYQYIDQMILVLQDSKILLTDVAAQNAVIKLGKFKRDQIYISSEDAYEMRRQALKAGDDGVKKIEITKDEAIQQIETKKKEIHDNLDSHFDQRLLEQNNEIKAVTIRMQTEKNEFESRYQTAVNEIETKGKQITDNIDAYFESRVNEHENKVEDQSKEMSDLETLTSGLTEDEKGLQRYLLEFYKKESIKIPVSPLSTKYRKSVEELYVPLQATIFCKNKNVAATKLVDVFQQDNKIMRTIYLTGEAGIGKSTFCRKVISLWCSVRENVGKSHDNTPVFDLGTRSSTENTEIQIVDEFDNYMDDLRYESYMSDESDTSLQEYNDDSSQGYQDLSTDQNPLISVAKSSQINDDDTDNASIQKFDFLFFISLRHTNLEVSIEEMVEKQLLYQDLKRVECFKNTIDRIPEKCLFILDGLDEWTQPKPLPTHPTVTRGLPLSSVGRKYVKLFTTRRWKYETLSPYIEDYELEVRLTGIGNTASKALIENMLESKDQIFVFETAVRLSDTYYLLSSPLLLKLLVCLWQENVKLETSKTELYCSIINIMLHLAEKRNDLGTSISTYEFPQMFGEFGYIKDNINLVFKLSQFAFRSLFEDACGSTNIFSAFDISQQGLSPDEIHYLLQTGLLTKKSISSQLTFIQKRSLSFIHRSFQEFFTAVHIAFADNERNKVRNIIACRCGKTYQIVEMANVFYFLADLHQNLYQNILKEIASHYRDRGISLGHELDLTLKLKEEDSCLTDIFFRGNPKSVVIESTNYGRKEVSFSRQNQKLQSLELRSVSLTHFAFKTLLESIPLSGKGVDITLICIGWIDEYFDKEVFLVQVRNVRKLKIEFTNLTKVEFMLPQNSCAVELTENDMTVSGLHTMMNSVSETKGEIDITLQSINLKKSKEDLNRELLIYVKNIRKLKIQSTNLTKIKWNVSRNIRTVELIDATLTSRNLSAIIESFRDTEVDVELNLNYTWYSVCKISKIVLNRSQIIDNVTLGANIKSTESVSQKNNCKIQSCQLNELWIKNTDLDGEFLSSREFDIINFVDVMIRIKELKKILGKKTIGHLCTVLENFKENDSVTFTGNNTDKVLISDRFNLRHQKFDILLEISVNDNKVVSVLTISNRLRYLNPKSLFSFFKFSSVEMSRNDLREVIKFIPRIEQMKLNLHFENITYLSTNDFEYLVEQLRNSARKIVSVTMDNDEGDIHVKDRLAYLYDTLKPEYVQGKGRPVLDLIKSFFEDFMRISNQHL